MKTIRITLLITSMFGAQAYSMEWLELFAPANKQEFENRHTNYKEIFETDTELVPLNGNSYQRTKLPKDNDHEHISLARRRWLFLTHTIKLRREAVIALNGQEHDYLQTHNSHTLNGIGKLAVGCMSLVLLAYGAHLMGLI